MTDSVTEDLHSHGFLAGLPEGTVELIAGCARWAHFDTGQLVLREGEAADTLHLVHRGRVVVEVHQPGDRALSIETVGPGHVVGISWVSPPYRWQFDARALEPVTTVAVDVEELRDELGRQPAIGFALLDRVASVLADRLQSTRVRLLDLHQLGDDRPR
ncbi:MAG: Crp/Fnr family transcriptional regulator [Acidimicrobiales bacterium]